MFIATPPLVISICHNDGYNFADKQVVLLKCLLYLFLNVMEHVREGCVRDGNTIRFLQVE